MQLKRHPFDLDVFAFGGLFLRRLRQKAPRSDVVGENQDRYRHSSRFYTPSYLKSAGVILPSVSFSSFASRNPARTIWRSMRLAVLDGEIVCPASAPPQNHKTPFQPPPQSAKGKVAAAGWYKVLTGLCTTLPTPCRGNRDRPTDENPIVNGKNNGRVAGTPNSGSGPVPYHYA
jgi:hypothetical protein